MKKTSSLGRAVKTSTEKAGLPPGSLIYIGEQRNSKTEIDIFNYSNTVFNETNNYGSSIFFKYKHRQDADEEKIGFKVTGDKKYQVRDYQDCMQRRDIMVYEHNSIRELTTFVKHETNAGNIRYASDGGNDDITMTIVNLTTVFNKSHLFYMAEEEFNKMSTTFQKVVNDLLNTKDSSFGTDYRTFTNSARRVRNLSNINTNNSYYKGGN